MSFIQFLFIAFVLFSIAYGIYCWIKMIFQKNVFSNLAQGDVPLNKRFYVDGEIYLQYPDKIIIGKITNISATGMFVNIPKDLPKIGKEISFKILLPNYGNKIVEGSGLVQWTRNKDDFGLKPSTKPYFQIPKHYRPAGFGLKFTSFQNESSGIFNHLMTSLKNFQLS